MIHEEDSYDERYYEEIKSSYNGNSNLKPIGLSISLEQWQVLELSKCAVDPIYFIENYCKIVSLDHGLIPFKLYECQKKKVNLILNNRKVILMESRQAGKTITSAACILWYTIFEERKTVAILANKAAAAREVMSRYQDMYELLPKWIQQGVREWNKGSIILENGCKVFTAATTVTGIRGRSVSWLYIDEASFIPNNIADAFFASTYPTIASGKTTKILISSTPRGYNHFWKFWNDATEGISDFIPLFIPYWEIPGRDEAWALEQKKDLGEVKFSQEISCQFLGSSYSLLDGETLSKLSPKQFILSKDNLDVLEEPIRRTFNEEGKLIGTDHIYMIVVDTSRGVGGDYSTFVVIDVTETPYTVVAKFRDNRISPLLFPTIIHTVARNYNDANVLIEINDNGQQVADILQIDLEYEHIIWTSREGNKGQVVTAGFGNSSASNGVRTDKKVKRVGCTHLKTLVESQKLLVFDKDIISEFSTFIEHKDSYAADEGYHDDLVMPLVLFGWLTTNPYFKDLTNINLRDKLYRDRMQSINDSLTPFGFFSVLEEKEKKQFVHEGDLWMIQDIPNYIDI